MAKKVAARRATKVAKPKVKKSVDPNLLLKFGSYTFYKDGTFRETFSTELTKWSLATSEVGPLILIFDNDEQCWMPEDDEAGSELAFELYYKVHPEEKPKKPKAEKKQMLCRYTLKDYGSMTFYTDGTCRHREDIEYRNWKLAHSDIGPILLTCYQSHLDDQYWSTSWFSDDPWQTGMAKAVMQALADKEVEKMLSSPDIEETDKQ